MLGVSKGLISGDGKLTTQSGILDLTWLMHVNGAAWVRVRKQQAVPGLAGGSGIVGLVRR